MTESDNGLMIHEPEVRTARLDRNLGNDIEQFVVSGGGQFLEPGGILGGFADGLDDVIALIPVIQKRRDQRWRVLHVAIHRDDSIAVSVIQTAGKRQLMAGVLGQENRLDMAVLLFELKQDFLAVIGRAIVYEDELPIVVKLGHFLTDCCIKMTQVVRFIIYGHYD